MAVFQDQIGSEMEETIIILEIWPKLQVGQDVQLGISPTILYLGVT